MHASSLSGIGPMQLLSQLTLFSDAESPGILEEVNFLLRSAV
jgi:hypothetical protein